MTTPEENTKIVETVMGKLAEGVSVYDIEELSDDIEWYICGSPDSPYVGRCIGKNSLDKTLTLLLGTTNTTHFILDSKIAQGNKVVVTAWEGFNLIPEKTGHDRRMAYNNIWVFTLTDDGIISKCEQMYNMAIEGMFGYTGY